MNFYVLAVTFQHAREKKDYSIRASYVSRFNTWHGTYFLYLARRQTHSKMGSPFLGGDIVFLRTMVLKPVDLLLYNRREDGSH